MTHTKANICSVTGLPIFASPEAAGRALAHLAGTSAFLPPPHRGGPSPASPPTDPRQIVALVALARRNGYAPIDDRGLGLLAYADALAEQLEARGI
jgi:hypothetical protein